MSESQLLERVIGPYERGEPITLQGRTVQPGDIAEIAITRADDHVDGHPLSLVRRMWRQDRRATGEWLVKNATDVTDTYVRGQPERPSAKAERTQPTEETKSGPGGSRTEAQIPIWLKVSLAIAGAIAGLIPLLQAPHWLQGLAAGVIGAAVLLYRRLSRSPPAGWAIAIIAGAGALLALVGWRLESTSTGDDHLPTASIATPTDGAHVPYRVRVAGTAEGIPLDSRPWLFVQSNDGDLYPQGGNNGNNVLIDRADQSWCGYAYFGVPDRSSAGERYALIVALATHGAERRLEREMQSQPIGQVPHWRSLPAGFEQLGDARVLTRLPQAQTQEQLEETKGC